MKRLLFFGFLLLSFSCFAQQSPQEMVDDFFVTYKNDPAKAIRDLYKSNAWAERKKDDIDKVVNAFDQLTVDFVGQYFGYELIQTNKLTDSFESNSYMVKYDRQPLRFVFKFYKPNEKWVLLSFAFDDSLEK